MLNTSTTLPPSRPSLTYLNTSTTLPPSPSPHAIVSQLAHAIGDSKSFWPKGVCLKVFFMDGAAYADIILQYARIWTEHSTISFIITNKMDESHIRITLEGGGCWSLIGTEATKHAGEATMCFGGIAYALESPEHYKKLIQRKVLHEFGHALGLKHEHQSSGAPIPWIKDKQRIYDFYLQEYNMSPGEVDSQILNSFTFTNGTKFDQDSIMIYPIPGELLTDPTQQIQFTEELSTMDKQFFKSEVYFANDDSKEQNGKFLEMYSEMIKKKSGKEILDSIVAEKALTVCILLIGKTGVGKSSLIRTFFGQIPQTQTKEMNIKVGTDGQSCTRKVRAYRYQVEKTNTTFFFIDTPGLFDSRGTSDEDHLNQIKEYLATHKITIDTVLYVTRFGGSIDASEKTLVQQYSTLFDKKSNDLFQKRLGVVLSYASPDIENLPIAGRAQELQQILRNCNNNRERAKKEAWKRHLKMRTDHFHEAFKFPVPVFPVNNSFLCETKDNGQPVLLDETEWMPMLIEGLCKLIGEVPLKLATLQLLRNAEETSHQSPARPPRGKSAPASPPEDATDDERRFRRGVSLAVDKVVKDNFWGWLEDAIQLGRGYAKGIVRSLRRLFFGEQTK